MSDNKLLYMNDPQLECYYIAALITIIVAGRRFGKTHGVVAPWLLRNTQHMPRSTGGIVCSTFQQALTRTLPGTLMAIEDMGYRRNLHYVVGIKPPKALNFATPLREPISYDHVVSWYNGSIWYLISQDVAGSANSLTLQYLMGDEAKFLDFQKLKDEAFPANGGFPGPWRDSPWLNSMLFVSDMPTTKKGSWFLNYADKATPEIVDAIKICLREIYKLSQMPPNGYTIKQLNYYRNNLAQLRRQAVYYRECSSIENVLILGEKYIRDMKRDLPPLVFLTSILCIRPGKLKDGFYPALSDNHIYTAFNNAHLSLIGYDFDHTPDCRQDGDLQAGQPIAIAFDYNSNINWLVAGQRQGDKIKTLKSFYVKYERKLREVVDDFCLYYRYHTPHEVVYYYDSTALGSNYAVNEDDFASVIINQFENNGWQVTAKYLGNPIRHYEKYLIIDQAFKGQGLYPQLLFNEQNNEALLIAMRLTGTRIGPKGWQKDKTGEKYAETEEDLLEYRTDGTDALDTMIIGMIIQPYETGNTFGSIEVHSR